MHHQDHPRRARRGLWSRLLASLGPRNPASARVWASVALVLTIATCQGTRQLRPGEPGWPNLVATVALVLLSAAILLLPARRSAPLVVLAPLAGTATVVWLDLVTADAGVTGQLFFCVPVIWAASQLRLGGAVVVAVATVAGDAVVVLTLLPRAEALVDLAYVATLLAIVTSVLAHSARTQDRLVERLRRQAEVDPLTGLATRRALDAATARAVAAVEEETSLVLIDLDHFKSVNDTHGHLGGDAALTHVAALLGEQCRDGDVVARMGGDELAVLLLHCSPETARRRAQAFVDAVHARTLLLADGTVVPLSISAGLATAPHDGRSAEELYAVADRALYRAKRAGRGQLGDRPAPLPPRPRPPAEVSG